MEQEQILSAEIGDIIQIDRGLYKHIGVYAGDGKIIHVNAEGKQASSGKVEKSLLTTVAGSDKVCVRNPDTYALTVHQVTPRTPQEIIKSAEEHLGKDVVYSFTSRNCEHYATEWRYGHAFSPQVVTNTVMASAGGGLLVAGLVTVISALFGGGQKRKRDEDEDSGSSKPNPSKRSR